MQITFDTENMSAQDVGILAHILEEHITPPKEARIFTGTAAQFLTPNDNPGAGLPVAAPMTDGVSMGQVAALSSTDANAAFGAAPLAQLAPYIADAGQQPIVQNMGMPTASGFQMPAPAFNLPATAQGAAMPQAAAQPSHHAHTGMSVLLDSAGLPWDARIHSSSKEKNKDDTWRGKRNTDKLLIAQVEAELRGAMNAGAAPQQFAQHTHLQPATQPVTTAPQQAQGAIDFPTLSMQVANLQSVGKLQMPELFEIVGMFGLQAFHLLQARPDLVPQIWQQIQLRTAGR